MMMRLVWAIAMIGYASGALANPFVPDYAFETAVVTMNTKSLAGKPRQEIYYFKDDMLAKTEPHNPSRRELITPSTRYTIWKEGDSYKVVEEPGYAPYYDAYIKGLSAVQQQTLAGNLQKVGPHLPVFKVTMTPNSAETSVTSDNNIEGASFNEQSFDCVEIYQPHRRHGELWSRQCYWHRQLVAEWQLPGGKEAWETVREAVGLKLNEPIDEALFTVPKTANHEVADKAKPLYREIREAVEASLGFMLEADYKREYVFLLEEAEF